MIEKDSVVTSKKKNNTQIICTQRKISRLAAILLCGLIVWMPFFFGESYTAKAETTWTVTNMNDSGAGSLRQVIQEVNAYSSDTKVIQFADGVGSITPLSPLPVLSVDSSNIKIVSNNTRALSGFMITISSGHCLTVSNVTIDNSSWYLPHPTIQIKDANPLNKILIHGSNMISADQTTRMPISVHSSTAITIDKITGGRDSDCLLRAVGMYGIGSEISAEGNITIQGGSISCVGIPCDGISGIVHITGGFVDAVGENSGISGRVTITGGTVNPSGKIADIEAYSCVITGGSVNTKNVSRMVTDRNGVPLYLTTITVDTVPHPHVEYQCSINNGPYFSAQTDGGGKLYFWLPQTGTGETGTVSIKDSTIQYRASGSVQANYENVMTAYPVPVVTDVTIAPPSVSVTKGKTQLFTASVNGFPYPPQTVSWSVLDGHAGTAITDAGLLFVDPYESSQTLTVKATSTFDTSKFGTATVTVLPVYLTVRFDTQGGSSIADQTVEKYHLVMEPPDPSKAGHIFDGWYTDLTYATPWNFDTDKVSDNMTLYAKWKICSYTVKFDSQGGSVISDQTVDYNQFAVKPPDPIKMGYSFKGWYTDLTYTTPWNFSEDTVTGNMTLYAKWDSTSSYIAFALVVFLLIVVIMCAVWILL